MEPNPPTAERRTRLDESTWTLLDQLAIAVVLTDLATGRILRVNKAMCELIGYSADELVALTIPDLTHPEDRESTATALDGIRHSRAASYNLEKRYIRRDGSVRWVQVSVTRLPRSAERPQVIGIAQDITARRLAEEQLAVSRERLALAQRVGRVGSFDWDIRTGTVVWTPELETLYGLAAGTFQGTFAAWEHHVHPHDVPRVKATLIEALAMRAPEVEYEFRAVLDTGELRWLSGRARFEYDHAGTPVRMIGTNTDITEQRLAAERLRQNQERFEIALRNTPVILFNHDTELRYTWIHNPAWAPPDAFIGRTDADLLPPESAGPLMSLKRRVLESGRGERAELQIATPQGGSYYDLTVEPIRDAAGRTTGLACAAIDLTARRRAERDRDRLLESERAARAEAERAGRLKDEFLATLSHELRTPLNAILGWAQVLQRHSADQRVSRGLQVIERNVRVQAQLIDDLLDMSRILSGKVRLLLEPIELGPIVETAIETLRPSAELKAITLVHTTDPGATGLVRADASRLQQVVWNLLSNAIKFTPPNGSIEVRLASAHGERHIVVSDTGSGIAPDFLPHVFERFRQADASSTRRHGGLGLGLAITRHLVEMHGGRIEASSPGPGHGATFTVTLPVIEAVSRRPARNLERPTVDLPGALEGVRVLVIDDDPDAREISEHVLSDRGATVVTAGSVHDALDTLSRETPDIVVSDISMPDVDGYEFIARLRALEGRAAKLPAVALTAFARDEDHAQAIAAGYDAHLAKPVDSQLLVETILSLAHGVRRSPLPPRSH